MKFIKLERKTLLRLGVLLLCVLIGLQGCRLASHTSPAAGCRIQTTASASRRALLTGRVSSQAQRAQAKQRTDSKSIQPISLNRATQAELETLPGIGEPITAEDYWLVGCALLGGGALLYRAMCKKNKA